MARFVIAPEVFQRLPGVCFGAVIAKGIDNTAQNPEIAALLAAEVAAAQERLAGQNLKEYGPIAVYREAFLALGINPNKYQSSVEALCKRVAKGAPFPSINPIVDLGNAMSLKYTLPMGAHDISKLQPDLEVRFSRLEDSFLPFGEIAPEVVPPGELVYASGTAVRTRNWIWRQSEDGKIDATTRDVLFPIDGFRGRNEAALFAARDELAERLRQLFGCPVRVGLLTEDCREITLED